MFRVVGWRRLHWPQAICWTSFRRFLNPNPSFLFGLELGPYFTSKKLTIAQATDAVVKGTAGRSLKNAIAKCNGGEVIDLEQLREDYPATGQKYDGEADSERSEDEDMPPPNKKRSVACACVQI